MCRYAKINPIIVKTPEAKKKLFEILLEAQKREAQRLHLDPSFLTAEEPEPSAWNFEKRS